MVTRRLVVASHNQHKIEEIKAITAHLNLQVLGLPEMGDYPPVLEDGETFQDNAKKKALEIAGLTGELVLADDSGLEVDALGGAPGVYSARFAGEPVSDGRNNELLLHKLAGLPLAERGAQFRCVIALAAPQGEVQFSEGICRGVILFEPRGRGGFGYDPLFFLPELGQTMAELQPEVKNTISHRYRAMRGILEPIRRLV
ncbi:MAG: XTP/dITP diphosphatase [Bacillota bacterium]|jgi:XTP/dITP diphosphohydrolase|nr:XTP/dITP diphosphatase [Bacillota bacterium]HHT90422.1 XTP/dITP diphosphatase [Bacillota bacterium]